jgi:two-component system, NarL family, nitrate/nitrite response regulator NarL
MEHAINPMQTQDNPIRIMLIDDHRSVLWGLEKLIDGEKPRMQVVGTATNSIEAMSLLGTISPDVILIDLDLNGESGASIIPNLIGKSTAKVLVLTGSRDLALHDNAMLAGARGVVGKGDTAETILKAITMVYQGEIWIDRLATSRIFNALSHKKNTVSDDPEQQKIATLTRKERLTAAEIASDATASTKIIADRLCIGESTLRNHLTSIYAKLELSSRLELFVYANKHGIHKTED